MQIIFDDVNANVESTRERVTKYKNLAVKKHKIKCAGKKF